MGIKETILRMIRQDAAALCIFAISMIVVIVGAFLVDAANASAIAVVETSSAYETEAPETTTEEAIEPETEEETSESDYISEDDRYCLACVICQEVGGMDEYMQTLVGNVVLNRVASPHFPNTIRGVLEQNYQYGMMWKYGVKFPSWATQADKDRCYEVADKLLSGKRICPENVVYQAEFPQGSDIYYYSEGVYFCYE